MIANDARGIRFGRTEHRCAPVGVGTWAHGGPKQVNGRSVGWSGHDAGRAREALLRAHARGVTHWDTADVYGAGIAETLIGSVWDRVPRDDIFLATKVGWDPGPFDHYYEPSHVRAQVELSLRNLRTDRIDLLYLHHCDFGEDDRYLEGAVKELRRARAAGQARFVGLSDWSCKRVLACAERVDPDAVQIYRNVVDDAYAASGLQSWVETNDVGVAFFSPLKHGLLLGKHAGPTRFADGDHRQGVAAFRDDELLAHYRRCREAVEERFADHPHPILHALIGALLADSSGACVLVGQRSADQAEAAATCGAPLAADDARWVRELFSRAPRPSSTRTASRAAPNRATR